MTAESPKEPPHSEVPRAEEPQRHARRLESLGLVAANVTHDLNNVLAVLLNSTDWIRNHIASDGEVVDALDTMDQAIRRAEGLVRWLMMLSKRAPNRVTPVDLGRTVEDAARLFRRLLPANMEVVASIESETEPWVMANAIQLQQVLLDLATCTRVATMEGTLHLTVSDGASGQVCLGARITGPGTMHQWDEAEMETELKEACEIIKEHGGRTVLEPQPDGGSDLRITLTLMEAPTPERSGEPVNVPRGQGELILLAEDNNYVLRVVATDLTELGYEILQVGDGPTLVERYRQHQERVDLMILDLDLPGRGGLECLRAIRSDGSQTPAIIITARLDVDLEEQLDERTILLCKPFRVAELGRLARDLLVGQSNLRSGREP